MARIQDYPSVTPTSSDNILIVQSTGQGLASVGSTFGAKLDKANPTGTGSLSLNRASGSTVGPYSTTEGYNCTASGNQAHAEGRETIASSTYTHSEGYMTKATGDLGSHAEGNSTESRGRNSHAEGQGTIATHRGQHVHGEYNLLDASTAAATARGNYVEIVGNGASDANRSNARTLDWSGNETLAGGLKVNGNQDVATLLNLSSEYKGASTSADLMAWFVTKCGTMADGVVAIVTINPNYTSDGFLGGSGIQPAIIFRSSSTVFRVAFPCICGQAYYYSNAWHYSKATMANVTPT
jgi:hypothetical protein